MYPRIAWEVVANPWDTRIALWEPPLALGDLQNSVFSENT
jgi:hypothetical protein